MDVEISEKAATEKRSLPAKGLLDRYLTDPELCRELKVTSRTTRKWRQAGEGPPWATIGATILYPIDDFHAWLRKRVRGSPKHGSRRGA